MLSAPANASYLSDDVLVGGGLLISHVSSRPSVQLRNNEAGDPNLTHLVNCFVPGRRVEE